MFNVLKRKYNDLTITAKGTFTPTLIGFNMTPTGVGIRGEYVVLMNRICLFSYDIYWSAATNVSATDVSFTLPVKSVPVNNEGVFKIYSNNIDWDSTNTNGLYMTIQNVAFGMPPPPVYPTIKIRNYKEGVSTDLATTAITSGLFNKIFIGSGWYMTNGET